MKHIKTAIILLVALLLLLVSTADAAVTAGAEKDKSKSEKEAFSLFKKAKTDMSKKNWEEAVKQFSKIADAYSDSKVAAESYYWLAYSMYKASDVLDNLDKILESQKAAIIYLETLRQQFPSSKWLDDGKRLQVEIAQELVKKGLSKYKKYIENGAAATSDDDLKLVALDALLNMDKEKAFPILEKIIRTSKNQKLRRKAIFIISQTRDDRVPPLLVSVALKDSDLKVREKAIFWLGQHGGKSVLADLDKIYKNLGDSKIDLMLKEKVIFSIGQVGNEKAMELLITIAKSDENIKMREKAVFWIGQQNSEKSLKLLLDIFNSTQNLSFKEKLIFSISQIERAGAYNKLKEIAKDQKEDSKVREKAIFWLSQRESTVNDVLPFFIGLYNSEGNIKLKEKLIFSISQVEENRAAKALIDIYKKETDVKLKKKIIFWLGQNSSKEAEEFIQSVLFN